MRVNTWKISPHQCMLTITQYIMHTNIVQNMQWRGLERHSRNWVRPEAQENRATGKLVWVRDSFFTIRRFVHVFSESSTMVNLLPSQNS